jgi:hypothetical protein
MLPYGLCYRIASTLRTWKLVPAKQKSVFFREWATIDGEIKVAKQKFRTLKSATQQKFNRCSVAGGQKKSPNQV